jgi:metal-responsive CopG/Arc/MetJ family transcriptional regulator
MNFMARVNIDIPKKRGPGRPRKPDAATTLVPVQLSKATVERLDQWAKANTISSRSGAARALIERALAAEVETVKPRRTK